MYETINVDCTPTTELLSEMERAEVFIAEHPQHPSSQYLHLYIGYIDFAIKARNYRLMGQIPLALSCEKAMESLYNRLPESYRW